MMKQKTIKRIVVAALAALLVVSMAFAMCMSMFKESSSAASISSPYISLSKDNINTNKEQYYDNSVIQKLPETVKDDDTISLIVEVKETPLLDKYQKLNTNMSFAEYSLTDEATATRESIKTQQEALLADLNETDIKYGNGAFYSSILSGFEITIKARDFEQTCKLFGDRANVIVGDVYNVAETQLVENEVNVYETGIFDSSKFGYDGTGMVVAILDTGIDYGHSAFSLENFTADRNKLGLTFDNVEALMKSHTFASEKLYDGLTASDVYINEKIPFGFDYADYDPDVFPIKSDHGTHVSGIVAGKDDTITGVAPNAQLVEMKIFSDVQDTAISSWILTALEDCVLLDVDVINMSIGTSAGFSRETDKEQISGVYDKVRDAGISLVVAASNSFSSTYGSEKNGNLGLTSNPDTGTIGSPATYSGALSVASISGVKTPYLLYGDKIMYFIESSDKVSEEKVFLDDILPNGVNEKEFEYITIPGVGRHADYTGLDVNGKIALVKRGDTTFEEKANVAQEMGAAGVIIYNNVSGDIKMNVGDITIAACSIGQDDGEVLAAAKTGTIKVSLSQTSGPFISDFSSWGPTPDLKIKPEITAHGGSILSAIPGQAYDRISGTSMACPNIAGATALLRQYVINKFPSISNDKSEIAKVVNSLFMSTADIIMNKNGLPYAVRKQGAGLASLDKAAATHAYIITYDENGEAMDKAKIELGADTNKTGVYTLKFSVYNFGDTKLSYDISTYVLTEGVSDTKTNNGETTVTEEAYSLDGAQISISSKNVSGKTVTVGAGETADVTVTITLGESDRKYLDESFENGMYVEGFVVLDAKEESSVDLSVPYLTFYGDWTVAPLFDLDYFETNKDELDDSISLLDKTLPDAYATRPVGGLESDYLSYLGSYYFIQNPSATPISADRKYISLTNQSDGINSLRAVWAGLLRNAVKVDVTITDDATGEVVYETTDRHVRKSYGDGGAIRPAEVDIDFSAIEQNLKNNTRYTVTLKGYLDDGDDDYNDGGNGNDTNLNNTFTFPLVTDFQAPTVDDVEFYTEYDKTTKKTKLFAKIAVYDNHYSMAMQVGYVTTNSEGFVLKNFDRYLTPIYSEEDSTTYVTYELTDYIYQIKESSYNKNTFTVACYDYALNQATYEIALPDDYIDMYFPESEVTLSPNEVYTLSPLVYPDTEWPELIEYTVTVPPTGEVARVVNNKLIALKPGVCQVLATSRDPETNELKQAKFTLRVLGEDDPGYKKFDKTVADNFKLNGYYVDKAYYIVDTSEREIGITGDEMKFVNNNYNLSLYPSESVTLRYTLDAYYPADTEVIFKSSNSSIVSVDENGRITANAEGFASISVNVMLDGKSTFYSQSISIEVKNPFINSGPSLTHYYGNGGTVEFPDNLAITEIGQFAFSNSEYVEKDPANGDVINDDYPDLLKVWYIGDNTIEKIIIPHGVEKIGSYAFANLTALKEIVLPSTLTTIDQGAFMGCTSLRTISYMDENGITTTGNGLKGVKLINQGAFQNTALNGTYNLDSAVAIASYAFAGNKNLDGIVLGESTVSVGNYAFYENTQLKTLKFNAEKIKLGTGAFSGCKALTEVSFNTEVIPAQLFDGAEKLKTVNLGASVAVMSENAFRGTSVSKITIDPANKTFKVKDNYITNIKGDTIVAVLPSVSGNFTVNNSSITTIGIGAFSGNTKITSVNIPSVIYVENHAFSGCTSLDEINLGNLEKIGDYAFYKTSLYELPSFGKLNLIGDYAFARTRIRSVTIHDGMTIGAHAFEDCYTLSSITIGDNVTIGDFTFNINLADNWAPVKGDDGYYRYEFNSPIKTLVIGKNANIGKYAFNGASEIEEITLGAGAIIGDGAFYNATSLVSIDLSKVISIGKEAFSGDTYNVFSNSSTTSDYYVIVDGKYLFVHYAPKFTSINLSALEFLGEGAFAGCYELESVHIGDKLKEISDRAFISCEKLEYINLKGVEKIGSNAFYTTVLTEANIPSATEIGSYAFSECPELVTVIFNTNGVNIGEGAFAKSAKLRIVKHMDSVTSIGDYSFAYTAVTDIDLSSAEYVGTHAFIKEALTPVTVKLSKSIKSFGDNPFALCQLSPFSTTSTITFNGNNYTVPEYTYDLNSSIKIIDGSLYQKVPAGLELVCFAGEDSTKTVADGTVRLSAYSFAGSHVKNVILPLTLESIGHKAFFACNSLASVTFTSYEAPTLEEEFDEAYYTAYDSIPAVGEFTLVEADGTEVLKQGLGIVPYFMWNATSFQSNCYYGANFVDYIGHYDPNIMMIRPANGQHYETFIYERYFNNVIDGMNAPDAITLAAIEAINNLPENIQLSHKPLVEAARAAYELIATIEQKALVTNLSVLTDAERRISDLEYLQNQGNEENKPSDETPVENEGPNMIIVIVTCVAIGVVVILAALFVIVCIIKAKKNKTTPPDDSDNTPDGEGDSSQCSEENGDSSESVEPETVENSTEETSAQDAEAPAEELSEEASEDNSDNGENA